MPGYSGNALAALLRDNQQAFLWQKEVIPANAAQGSLSVAFQLERINRSFYPWGLSFEASFASAPGAFEIDIMGANTDIGFPNPGYFIQLGNITSVNGSNVGRWDMAANMWPKYVAAFMKTLTNAVAVTLQVTR
jgi:hypothetical protein